MNRLAKLVRCEQGGSAIEYALVGVLISVAALAAMTTLGSKVDAMYGNVSSHM